jgi:hypothetical protein
VITLLCGTLPGKERAIIAIGSSAIANNISGLTLTYMAYYGTFVAGNVRQVCCSCLCVILFVLQHPVILFKLISHTSLI